MNSNLKLKISQLPMTPGVYIYKDIKGVVIYVGKAKALRNRVGSYFLSNILPGTKTYALVSRINDIDTIKVENELEALILEAELIKKYRPKYNIIQKDDKSYLYIVIRKAVTTFAGKDYDMPNIITVRESDLIKDDKIFGPYPNGAIARDILRKIRLLFPFKDCGSSKFNIYHNKHRPCLYGQIGLCPAPCVNYTETDLLRNKELVLSIKKLLSGKSKRITTDLNKKMVLSSNKNDFESAIYYRDLLNKFNYVSNSVRSPETYMENPYLMDDIGKKALEELMKMIPTLKTLPKRIECYDISNISGKEAVGSMVVAINGQIAKREYKRFKIKLGDQPNDFEMLSEVLDRRLRHSFNYKNDDSNSAKEDGKEKWQKPDLLLIDGGKGQVAAIEEVKKYFDADVCVAGLAKRIETVVYKSEGVFVEGHYPKDLEGMKLLIRLRDEAHRFAQSYHHLLRQKKLKGNFITK